jgi:hypothetical protein
LGNTYFKKSGTGGQELLERNACYESEQMVALTAGSRMVAVHEQGGDCMEKRRYRRVVVRDMQIDISDGIGCCSGTVRDISRVGLCLAELGKRFGKNIDAYMVVASNENFHFKFRVRPKWEQAGRLRKRVGVEIHEPPPQWTEYVMSLESKTKRS